jgi:hypothetical protein
MAQASDDLVRPSHDPLVGEKSGGRAALGSEDDARLARSALSMVTVQVHHRTAKLAGRSMP